MKYYKRYIDWIRGKLEAQAVPHLIGWIIVVQLLLVIVWVVK